MFYIIASPPSDECQLVYGIIDTGTYELCSKMDEREACTNITILKSTRRFRYCFVCGMAFFFGFFIVCEKMTGVCYAGQKNY